MDAYAILQKQAAAKLDQAIQAARREYRETIDRINQLRRELGHEPPTKGLRVERTFTELVRDHHPQDRPYTANDVLVIVQAVEPNRIFKRGTLKTILHKMGDLALIRRVAKDRKGYVLWAAAGCEVETKPYAAMPLSDVIADILEGSEAMRPAELVVAVQRLGDRSEDDPRELLLVVRKSLYANPRRFIKAENGGWGVGY